MNKIFNINLGGYPFTIDEDAFQKLDKYLKTISGHFSSSEGCDEIVSDIESRIAELFMEHLKGRPIISMKEVDNVITVMGTPEEFGATEEQAQKKTHREEKKSKTKSEFEEDSSTWKTGKRLFREPDEKIISGVCAGLAAYFGIQDPVWVRIAFAIGVFMGFGLIVYVVLWIAIPEAKTSGDKLSMKGEKIDVSNIARKVEEEMNQLADSISEMTKDFGSKKKV